MIALYAAFYLIINTLSYNGGTLSLPYQSLAECQAAASQLSEQATTRAGPSLRAFCIQGNKP